MKRVRFIASALVGGSLLGLVLLLVTAKVMAAHGNGVAIVPEPEKVQRLDGSFRLRAQARILVDPAGRETGEYLAERLRQATGFELPVVAHAKGQETRGAILVSTQKADASLGEEGYRLKVDVDSACIWAPKPAGLFYGVQSLLQLLPPEVFASKPVANVTWAVPCVNIEDRPRFGWRGMLLDVSRHFFNKEEVKTFLDAMALHKLNVFQWHLTDDQGWRIEIKRWPELTRVGAWRQRIGFNLDPRASTAFGPDGRYGGYYTQEEIREIVAYAQARHITIVPEIEMPGHASAALAAYPQFSCSGGPFSTDVGSGVFAGVYCAGKEETFTFVQDVLSEVVGLFPGPFIHIGADEVPKKSWHACAACQARMQAEGLKDEQALQGYFVQRIETFLSSRGRRLIGWSEITKGGLAGNAALMDWVGGGVEAASSGHDVIMTPNTHCYFDYYQSRDRTNEPPAIGAFLPLEKVYAFEPIPAELAPQYRSHILGGQGNVWTEYMPSLQQVEYMTFPRLCALSEAVWSPAAVRDWSDFRQRLPADLRRLDELGITYRKGS